MSDRRDEITIKVGFGKEVKELTVRIPDGDIPPYQVGDSLAVVGGRHDRLDGRAKVTGRAKYTYDRNLEGMLYGRILRCEAASAEIESVDLSGAQAVPGVHATISFLDVFRTKEIRYAWDGLAAVAAETEAQAEEALKRIVVKLVKRPAVVTTQAAMAEGAPSAVPGEPNVVVMGQRRNESDADFAKRLADQKERCDAALKEADFVVTGRYDTQVQIHCPLEPHGVVCSWEGEELLCYASTQATFGCLDEATNPRGPVKAASARVLAEYVGGGFGSKFGLGREGVAGALLAKKAGRPVKLMLDRLEELTSVGNRPDALQEMTVGIRKDGSVTGLRAHSWGTSGPSPFGAGTRNTALYALGEVDKVEHGVRTNCGPAAAMRAPGFPQGVYALECILDDAAHAAGLDPLELRRKIDDHPIRKVEWEMAAEAFGWKDKRRKKPGEGKGPIKSGVGCGGTVWFAAGGGGASVIVRIHKNGAVEVRNGCQDIGTGTRTVMGMVAAEELGLPLEKIQTFIGDTRDPAGPGSGGSTTIGSLTPAARIAAYEAKRELLAKVAERHQWKVDDLDLKAGKVVRRDGKSLGKEVSFEQACDLITEGAIEVNERRPTIDRRNANYAGFSDTNAGVQMAEVEVDCDTGEVRVKRVLAIQDCGKVINAKTAESQVRGGVIQGVSYALFERRVMDRQEGRMVNGDMEMYKIAGPMDCPEIDVRMLDVCNGKNNTSVMGLGEPPKIATAAAIANAVFHAIGVRVHSLPITPAKVLEALAAHKEKK